MSAGARPLPFGARRSRPLWCPLWCPDTTWARLVALLFAVFGILGWSSPALAQHVEINASVDANEIELGDTVTYTLQASSTTNAPSDPRLPTPQGFTIVNQGASPTHMVSIINGRASEKHGLTAQWSLRADRLGTFTIGPANISIGTGRRNAPPQRVTVVAPGKGRPNARRGGPRPFDPFGGGGSPFGGGGSPFDPFKGLIPGIDDDNSSDVLGALSTDPKLALDSPRGQVAFLHATIDKTRAVVGEQVTLNVYLYEDLHARQGRPTDVHEATATDFVKRSLLQDETHATHVGNALVGGRPWSVKLVRKNALFPIKTGRLAIAPMSLTISQPRGGLRESETLYVDVTEPPIKNRPAGYQIGDTGDFSLSATVTPRNIDQHGAVGVNVELRGTGNMPATLPTPEIAGVEWLEPQTRDSLGPVSNDRFGGTRTFSYVVRLHKEGSVDLGEIRVPYWDPQARAYSVARTALGIVQVARAAGRDAGPDVAEPLLPGLPKPRSALEGKHAETYLTERPAYWGALFGSPLVCVGAIALSGAVRRARERRAKATPSPERIAKERRAEAEAALKGSDGKAAFAAIARAFEAEILARAGVNVRGTSGERTVRELTDAGVSEEVAKQVLEILSACEDARFAPSTGDDAAPMNDARALWRRAKVTLEELGDYATDKTSVPPSKDVV